MGGAAKGCKAPLPGVGEQQRLRGPAFSSLGSADLGEEVVVSILRRWWDDIESELLAGNRQGIFEVFGVVKLITARS